jgi:hypothetical protein
MVMGGLQVAMSVMAMGHVDVLCCWGHHNVFFTLFFMVL